MLGEEAEAIVFLIDNSPTSINGDFYPTRLDAQKLAVERLIEYFHRKNSAHQFAIGTLAQGELGIIASLSNKIEKALDILPTIKRGGSIQIARGLKSSFLALKHHHREIKTKHIILFVCSDHNLSFSDAVQLGDDAKKEEIILDIVAFGPEINDIDVLRQIVDTVSSDNFLSTFLEVPV